MEIIWTNYRKIAIDTNCFIYLMEGSPFNTILRSLFQTIEEGHITAVSSVLTVTELLRSPAKTGDTRLWEEYRAVLYRFPNLSFRNIDPLIAERAAQLRASHKLKTPDAIQVATAMLENADVFVTNDNELLRCDFPVLLLSEHIRQKGS